MSNERCMWVARAFHAAPMHWQESYYDREPTHRELAVVAWCPDHQHECRMRVEQRPYEADKIGKHLTVQHAQADRSGIGTVFQSPQGWRILIVFDDEPSNQAMIACTDEHDGLRTARHNWPFVNLMDAGEYLSTVDAYVAGKLDSI